MKNVRLTLAIHKLLGRGSIRPPIDQHVPAKPSNAPKPMLPYEARAQRRHVERMAKTRER